MGKSDPARFLAQGLIRRPASRERQWAIWAATRRSRVAASGTIAAISGVNWMLS